MFASLKKTSFAITVFFLNSLIVIYRKFKPVRPSVYFCYNQSVHHIYHSIFIAIELSNIQEYPVVILSTSSEATRIIEKELSSIPNRVVFKKIRHFGYNQVNFNVNWFVFFCRLYIHKPKALVVTDYYDTVFKRLGLNSYWAYTFHGPENRGYTDPHIKDFDLILVSGEGELERLRARVGELSNYAITGYSKFDYFYYHKAGSPLFFKDSRPVIIYNPHFGHEQSSFFDKGLEFLRALSETRAYNIIFMPHPDLAREYPEQISKARGLADVIVSERTRINLDYMAEADIYITDVSSAVFEWLYFNRPAIFFNTKAKQKDTYPSWACGRVVEDIPEMVRAIEDTLKNPDEFALKRREVFDRTFSNRDNSVSRNIASLILDKMNMPQFFFYGNLSKKYGASARITSIIKSLGAEKRVNLVCIDAKPNDFHGQKVSISRINTIPLKRILSLTPLRWNLKAMTFLELNLFDYFASKCVGDYSPVYASQGAALNVFQEAKKRRLKTTLIARTLHVDLVWELHKEEAGILGYDYEWLGTALKNKILQEYSLADTIIVASKLTYQSFIDAGIDQGKLRYFPVGIDRNYFKRKNSKGDSTFRILYVGRLCPQKGIHYLIRAFKELGLPGAELLLFGSTATRAEKEWLDRLIDKDKNIKLSSGDSASAYEQSSLLVHPSLNDNTAQSVYEALAYGLPVVVTENTGAKEAIEEPSNGFVIPVRDVKAIKEKIVYYYNKTQGRVNLT
jgi:glycosyltransferase involved in cell wall biosynthesis